MSGVRDVAFIRELCRVGLPARTLVQSLLPALRGIVPSHSAGVFWVDERGAMRSLYAERMLPPDAMARYHERHASSTDGFAEAFARRAAAASPVSWHAFTLAEQRSDYFRDVMRPLDAYHVLYGIARNGGRPIAQLSFYRGAADAPFDAKAADALASVLRYLGPALARESAADEPIASGVVVEEALGVVDRDGEPIAITEAWSRMIRLLALASVAPSDARRESARVRDYVAALAREMLPPAADGEGAAESAARVIESPWGRHTLRAWRLPDARGRRIEQVGMLLRREEPQSVALVRGTGASELSPRQREVALLLAQGRSNPEIAEALGLTVNTASYHVKHVFARLGVNSRGEVAALLLQLAQRAAAQ